MSPRAPTAQEDLFVRRCDGCGEIKPLWGGDFASDDKSKLTNRWCRRCLRRNRGSRSREQSGLGTRSVSLDRVHLAVVSYPRGVARPRTRADCVDGPRPCPWVSCKWHLLLDVHGETVRVTVPEVVERGIHLERMEHTCALDLADEDAMSLEETGRRLNVTIERVRQIQEEAIRKIREASDRGHDIGDWEPDDDERETARTVSAQTPKRAPMELDESSADDRYERVPGFAEEDGGRYDAHWARRMYSAYLGAHSDEDAVPSPLPEGDDVSDERARTERLERYLDAMLR